MTQERPLLTALYWTWLLLLLAGLTGCGRASSSESVINTAVAETMEAMPPATATRVPPTPTLLVPPTMEVSLPGSNTAAVTTRQRVSVRSGPGEAYPGYGVIPVGTTAEVAGMSQDGAWWVIKLPASLVASGLGWISAQYVDSANTRNVPVLPPPPLPAKVTPIPPQANGPAVVAVETLVVRLGPSMDYPAIGIVPGGTSLQAIGVSPDHNWWEVGLPVEVASDGQGWVPIYYVQAYNTWNLPEVEPPPLK